MEMTKGKYIHYLSQMQLNKRPIPRRLRTIQTARASKHTEEDIQHSQREMGREMERERVTIVPDSV